MELEAVIDPDKLGQFHTFYCVAVPRAEPPPRSLRPILFYCIRRTEHEKDILHDIGAAFYPGIVRLR